MKSKLFYLLLAKNSSENKTELESETIPYTFKSNGHRLRNYRIYGNTVNGESVGDIVTEGEHSGEYLLPVTVQGKNLLKNTAVSRKINNVTFTVNEDGSVTTNGVAEQAAVFEMPIQLLSSTTYILSGCHKGGSNDSYRIDIRSAGSNVSDINGNVILDYGLGYTFSLQSNIAGSIAIRIAPGYTCDNLTFYPMIRKADIEDDTYEPYHEPQTINIYLDEQLNENDYIDFRKQKRYPSGDMISLPAIPTIDGTTVISVNTETQPSKIYLQGNITEIETVSAQALQANIQSLQPLSLDENAELDVMPSDKNEFQTNDISEMPVEDENSIEEILETENLETTGDDENAE